MTAKVGWVVQRNPPNRYPPCLARPYVDGDLQDDIVYAETLGEVRKMLADKGLVKVKEWSDMETLVELWT